MWSSSYRFPSILPNVTIWTKRSSLVLRICPNRFSFRFMTKCTRFLLAPNLFLTVIFVTFCCQLLCRPSQNRRRKSPDYEVASPYRIMWLIIRRQKLNNPKCFKRVKIVKFLPFILGYRND